MVLNNDNKDFFFNTDDSDYLPSSSNPEDINVYTAGNEEQEGQVSLSSFLETRKEPDNKPEFVKKVTGFVGKFMPKKSLHSANKKGNKWQKIGRVALTVFLVGLITCGIGIGTIVAWLASEDARVPLKWRVMTLTAH